MKAAVKTMMTATESPSRRARVCAPLAVAAAAAAAHGRGDFRLARALRARWAQPVLALAVALAPALARAASR